jgi:hypothetical protein
MAHSARLSLCHAHTDNCHQNGAGGQDERQETSHRHRMFVATLRVDVMRQNDKSPAILGEANDNRANNRVTQAQLMLRLSVP